MARIPKTKKDKKELKRLREETNYESPLKNLSDYRLGRIDQRITEKAVRERAQYLTQKIRVEINIFNESENKKINHLLFSSQTGIYNFDVYNLTTRDIKAGAEIVDFMINDKLLPYMVNEIKKKLGEEIKTYLEKLLKLREEELGL